MTEPNAAAVGTAPYLTEPIPRSVVLSAWLNSWATQQSSADEVLAALETFGPHRIVASEASGLLLGLSELGIRPEGKPLGIRAVLPVAGDPDGLPGPPAFNREAIAAEQAVVLIDAGIGLIPRSDCQPEGTDWSVQPVDSDNLRTPSITAEQASSEVRAALLQATNSLGSLAQTANRETVEADLKDMSRRLDRTRLPRSLSPDRQHTIRLAAQILGICSIATAHTVNQLTAAATQDQSQTLRELSRTARRALAAAVSTR